MFLKKFFCLAREYLFAKHLVDAKSTFYNKRLTYLNIKIYQIGSIWHLIAAKNPGMAA